MKQLPPELSHGEVAHAPDVGPQADAPDIASARDLAIRWFDEVWNQRREETIEEILSPDLVAQMEGHEGDMGKDDFKKYWTALLNAVPDLHLEIVDTTEDGSKVVVNWIVTGTHLGPGMGVPPSGQPVEFHGLSWLEFEDGRMVRGFDKWNRGEVIASLMRVRMGEIQERHGLTPREAQVALMMAERRTYKEIAKDLGIRPNTARRHAQKVLRKLRIHRREDVAEALAVAKKSVLTRHGSDLA